jgi:NADH-quinone oxidoreductase subunit I
MSQPMSQASPTSPQAAPPSPPPAHPTTTKPYKYSLADRLYLPLLQGMMVTARHFFKNLRKSKYTISYPEEKRPYSGRYRGHHILTTRPDGSVRCVACFLCATNCPAECIHI